jgi:endonuclease/exonuclease/phosphatase family metal-dependent hydrolase
MTLKVASWNIEGRLSNLAVSRRGTPQHILKGITRLQADILFLAEAFGSEQLEDYIRHHIRELGYHMIEIAYEEGGEKRAKSAVYRPSMMLLSKFPFVSHEKIRLGNLRNAVVAHIKDPESGEILRIIGIHLDDRSELLRLQQIPDLIQHINTTHEPTIIMGDFNAMHGGDMVPAKLLQSFPLRVAAKYVLSDLALRAVDMAKGDTLSQLLGETGLRDADPRHRPTSTPILRGQEWLPSIRLMQIEHILLSPRLSASDFHISPDGGADHRAISAMITLDKTE